MHIQGLTGDWQFRQAGTEEWLHACVPGGVHTDLLALGRIPDPFVGDNEKQVQWVAESDWEYRYSFACAPELLSEEGFYAIKRVRLVFDGLDTLAVVSLNGQELGRTDNMFRQYRWDVKQLLSRDKANELLITFASPVKYAAAKQAVRPLPGVPQAIPGGPYLRKAPCHFGWDWGPQLPPIGVWKDVRLEGYSVARLDEVHLRQHHSEGRVTIEAQVTVERWSETPASTAPATLYLLPSPFAFVRVTTPDGEVLDGEADVSGSGEATVRVPVPNPQLWWPNGYGKQPLYKVEVGISRADEGLKTGDEGSSPPGGYPADRQQAPRYSVLSNRYFTVGLRTIELRQEEDQWGRSFAFVVNGVPVFAKGSNWIPADSFPTRISDEDMEGLIRSAVDTHQNMLRVWGGGFYEEERFYDLCDRYGILVWQDFIFSCSVYPLNNPEFHENVRIEAIENIRRIRHRASLALWCGNNEMEQGWVEWGWDVHELQDTKAAYDRFFHHTLREWCAAEDPGHAYWPSSPSSGTPFVDPNGQRQGDAHYWDVWHGRKPFTAYRGQYPRFMSEFGFQALPPMETVRTYAVEADWNMTSYIMEQHQKNASGNSLMASQMLDTFRLPKDFDSLVYLSMVLQAEGIRYGVEHWRRHMDRVAGTLYWQLNDCWPVASWSSLDYFGRWKALHYAARRFYAPVMLSIEDAGTAQGLYVTSDLREPWEGRIRWSLEALKGEVLASSEERLNVGPLRSAHIRTIDFADRVSDDNRRELVFAAELWKDGERQALQIATFAPTKHLSLDDPALAASVSSNDENLSIEVTSQSLARLVELSLDGAEVVFSDNYFDLPTGRIVTVTCPLPPGWTLEQARAALRLRSVYDSYR